MTDSVSERNGVLCYRKTGLFDIQCLNSVWGSVVNLLTAVVEIS